MGDFYFESFGAIISLTNTIGTIALVLVAVQLSVSFRAWRLEQRISKTIDVLASYKTSANVPSEALHALSPEGYVGELGYLHSDYRSQITKYLNEMEFVSLLINNGSLDKESSYRYLRGDIVDNFARMLGYILVAREAARNSSLYTEFETLARDWANDR